MKSQSATSIKFTKMHGIGNDFVLIDARGQTLDLNPQTIARLSDRHFGIGCDQLVVLKPSQIADAEMLIYNQDSSLVQACGNASRCVAKYLSEQNPTPPSEICIQTHDRILDCRIEGATISVNMGKARTGWQDIPFARPIDTKQASILDPMDEAKFGTATLINMGNPHCVFFVENEKTLNDLDLSRLGTQAGKHEGFVEGCNVEFVTQTGDARLKQRTWERGVGETLACGSGACAVAVAASIHGLIKTSAEIELEGGALTIQIDPQTQDIWMSGPAEYVFEGTLSQ